MAINEQSYTVLFQPSEDSGTRLVSPEVLFAPLGFSVEKEEEPPFAGSTAPSILQGPLSSPSQLRSQTKGVGPEEGASVGGLGAQ